MGVEMVDGSIVFGGCMETGSWGCDCDWSHATSLHFTSLRHRENPQADAVDW